MDRRTAPAAEPDDLERRNVLIHREVLQITVLMVVAVVGFFLTRALAANTRNAVLADAEAWFARGQQEIAAGRLDAGIDSLRRASVRNRYERRYVLALAEALGRKGDTESARAALLTLRDASPEDVAVNLALARLAAQRHDVTEAVRFYHNALYAPWPTDAVGARRQVRFELIELLLANDQAARALPELLAVSSDLPDDAAVHVRVGRLFGRAGDDLHALDQYERALQQAHDDPAALTGAGISAFQLGRYAAAREYLRRAPADRDDVRRIREITNVVLANDPLARRLGPAERRRRLAGDIEYIQQRLGECAAKNSATTGAGSTDLSQEIEDFRQQLRTPAAIDQDAIERGIDLIVRAEKDISNGCGPQTTFDEALTLIARQHGSDTR